MPVTVQLAPTRFDEQEGRRDPAKTMILALPALHLVTDFADGGKTGFDCVRTAKRLTKRWWEAQMDDRQSFLQPFDQTARRARIALQELIVQLIKCMLCVHPFPLQISRTHAELHGM